MPPPSVLPPSPVRHPPPSPQLPVPTSHPPAVWRQLAPEQRRQLAQLVAELLRRQWHARQPRTEDADG